MCTMNHAVMGNALSLTWPWIPMGTMLGTVFVGGMLLVCIYWLLKYQFPRRHNMLFASSAERVRPYESGYQAESLREPRARTAQEEDTHSSLPCYEQPQTQYPQLPLEMLPPEE